MLTQSRLRQVFNYDSITGVVTRRMCTANRHKLGEVVGVRGARGYLQATVDSQKHPLHRLIWVWVHGVWPPNDLDHWNRNRADNRLKNLRPATRSENNHNQGLSKRNTSGFVGVSWDESRKAWIASIGYDNKLRYLGRYPTPEEASRAYLAAKRIFHPTAPTK